MTWKQLLKNKLNKKLKRSQWYNTAAQATLTLHLVSKNMDSTCNDFSPLFATCEITPGAQHPHGEGWSTQHARKGWEREMGLVNPKKRRWRGNTLLLSSGEYRENTGRLLETCVTIGQAVTSSHWTREILSTSTGKKKKKSSLKGLSNTGTHTYGTHRSGIPIPRDTQNPTGHGPGHCNVVVPSLNMCGELYDIPV